MGDLDLRGVIRRQRSRGCGTGTSPAYREVDSTVCSAIQARLQPSKLDLVRGIFVRLATSGWALERSSRPIPSVDDQHANDAAEAVILDRGAGERSPWIVIHTHEHHVRTMIRTQLETPGPISLVLEHHG